MLKTLVKLKNKGFTLIELIVVIAIMAVLAAVLVPSLVHYIDESKAAKDDAAMGELTKVINNSMSDITVYDAVLNEAVSGPSCYVDGSNPAESDAMAMFEQDDGASKIFGKEFRKLNGKYSFAGNCYGVRLVFEQKQNCIALRDAYVNTSNRLLKDSEPLKLLYNKINSVIGESLEITSNRYKDAPYTVFIAFGTISEKSEGKDAFDISDEPVLIYGQWGGCNIE